MLKFLVKVFMSLYLLKLLMDQVDTLHVCRYWSEVLCCTIMTHLGDFEFKVTDFEISESESAKYSKHLINRVLHGAPIIEVIFFERREASACLINAERQAR